MKSCQHPPFFILDLTLTFPGDFPHTSVFVPDPKSVDTEVNMCMCVCVCPHVLSVSSAGMYDEMCYEKE